MVHNNTVAEQYAIFETGGKQYQAIPEKTVAIEKLVGEPGTVVEFDHVLFKKIGAESFEVGKPYLKTTIKAVIIRQDKHPKVEVIRFKRRKKVRVHRGHRQPFTVVRIQSI